jgi:hypothetical protein
MQAEAMTPIRNLVLSLYAVRDVIMPTGEAAVLTSQTSKSRLEAENAAVRFTARIWSLRFPKLVDRSLPELLD